MGDSVLLQRNPPLVPLVTLLLVAAAAAKPTQKMFFLLQNLLAQGLFDGQEESCLVRVHMGRYMHPLFLA